MNELQKTAKTILSEETTDNTLTEGFLDLVAKGLTMITKKSMKDVIRDLSGMWEADTLKLADDKLKGDISDENFAKVKEIIASARAAAMKKTTISDADKAYKAGVQEIAKLS